jgi:hypothetical protein
MNKITNINNPEIFIAVEELKIRESIENLFKASGKISDLVSGLVDNIWISNTPDLEFVPSPPTQDSKGNPLPGQDINERVKEELKSCQVVICIGSDLYNSVTRYYFEEFPPVYKINQNSRYVEDLLQGGNPKKIGMDLDNSGYDDFGILLRVRPDELENPVFFVAAGAGINATKVAVQYLVDNWEELHDKRKDIKDDFHIVFECLSFDKEKDGSSAKKLKPRICCVHPHDVKRPFPDFS